MKKIALFGGSFDPVHKGHISLVEEAIKTFSLDHCLVLPCKQSPHKDHAPLASDEERMKMCEMAFSHLDKVNVSDLEIRREDSPSYSWMTVENIRLKYPEASLYWIMGTDQWDALEKWSRYEYLINQLSFIIVERQARVSEKEKVRFSPLKFNSPHSSTRIRKALLEGEQPVGLAPSILAYIEENNLYR